jgi:hypothetical protein
MLIYIGDETVTQFPHEMLTYTQDSIWRKLGRGGGRGRGKLLPDLYSD